ncbi:DNA-binding protein [Halomicrococcus sp. NG-SE-24]|uniref:DNA-binding protein n=1 Tax=Halomicrococcus sp. NG-SE-24 TaxID=3436928 RepID=UPI003D973721
MTSDPDAVADALATASQAFERGGTPEDGLAELSEDEAQLRKACRLIAAARTLQNHNGYHTAVVELTFGAIERSFEFYAIALGNDAVRDFMDHEYAYQRVFELGAISETLKEDFQALYNENRAASYYSGRAVTAEQANAMLGLAVEAHEFLRDHPRDHFNCLCE